MNLVLLNMKNKETKGVFVALRRFFKDQLRNAILIQVGQGKPGKL